MRQRYNFTIYLKTSENANVKTLYQYSNNTIISFVMQYKYDNTAFHRSSAVFVALASKSDVTGCGRYKLRKNLLITSLA